MDEITAIYINKAEDQLVLKRASLPNMVMLVKHAVDVLRILYAIKYEDGIPVYQLDFDDLDQYLNDNKLPAKHFRVPEPQVEVDDESEGDVDEGPTKTPGPGLSMSSKVINCFVPST